MTDPQKLDHYRLHLKIYGFLLMELAESDEEIRSLIHAQNLSPLMHELRERIENTQVD